MKIGLSDYGFTGTVVQKGARKSIPMSYNDLPEETLPRINNVILKGSITSRDLGIPEKEEAKPMDEHTIDEIWMEVFG